MFSELNKQKTFRHGRFPVNHDAPAVDAQILLLIFTINEYQLWTAKLCLSFFPVFYDLVA